MDHTKSQLAGLVRLERFNRFELTINNKFKENDTKLLPLASRLEVQDLINDLKEAQLRKMANFIYRKDFNETRDKICDKIDCNGSGLEFMKKSFVELNSIVGGHSKFLPTLASVD